MASPLMIEIALHYACTHMREAFDYDLRRQEAPAVREAVKYLRENHFIIWDPDAHCHFARQKLRDFVKRLQQVPMDPEREMSIHEYQRINREAVEDAAHREGRVEIDVEHIAGEADRFEVVSHISTDMIDAGKMAAAKNGYALPDGFFSDVYHAMRVLEAIPDDTEPHTAGLTGEEVQSHQPVPHTASNPSLGDQLRFVKRFDKLTGRFDRILQYTQTEYVIPGDYGLENEAGYKSIWRDVPIERG